MGMGSYTPRPPGASYLTRRDHWRPGLLEVLEWGDRRVGKGVLVYTFLQEGDSPEVMPTWEWT